MFRSYYIYNFRKSGGNCTLYQNQMEIICVSCITRRQVRCHETCPNSDTITHHTTLSQIQHIVLITILLHNVMDKKHSDDQINTSRLFSSNKELLPMLTIWFLPLCARLLCAKQYQHKEHVHRHPMSASWPTLFSVRSCSSLKNPSTTKTPFCLH